ncbi:MAG: methionyl-tRNA formyltransferase [Anaerolineales bacterium]|nr:methionyl-tRNA formyltransferase [Anaerolineales bacterium]
MCYNHAMATAPRIVFMGSPDFAVPILEALTRAYPVVGVVTQPDRPAGRGRILVPPPVKETALRLGLPVIQPERLRQPVAMDQLRTWAPDLIVVTAFGQILKPEVLELPLHGCINVHASLLPRGRGAAPIQAALLAGDAETGVTIMRMDPGVDTGPLYASRAIPIAAEETAGTLFAKLALLGADLLLETLPGILNGELQPRPQPAEGVTYAAMLKKEDGRLDFTRPAVELERRVRAMNPWPGAFFDWQGASLKVHKAHTAFALPYVFQQAGTRSVHAGQPAIYGSDNTMLVLDEVQPAGRKPMSGKAFLAGAREWSA